MGVGTGDENGIGDWEFGAICRVRRPGERPGQRPGVEILEEGAGHKGPARRRTSVAADWEEGAAAGQDRGRSEEQRIGSRSGLIA